MTELKFRAWDNIDYMSTPFTLKDIQNKKIEFTSDAKVMQFTGLKDKIGIEIYDGYILSEKWRVEVYRNIEGTFMVRFHTNPSVNKPRSLYRYLKARETAGTSKTDCIVIGNIYENSDLLQSV